MSATTYRGRRINPGPDWSGDLLVEVLYDGSPTVYPLAWRLDLRNHSPTGLECGYGGSGPAQLALAILAHHFGPQGERHALALYQQYKGDVVAHLPQDAGWEIGSDDVAAWLRDRGEDAVN
jgi:hypothetical protein